MQHSVSFQSNRMPLDKWSFLVRFASSQRKALWPDAFANPLLRYTGGSTYVTWAHWMRATFPSQSTFCVFSSGLAVEQSMIAWIPTNAAGRLVESFRSAWTVVAPQSLRKSAGFCLGRTMHLTFIMATINVSAEQAKTRYIDKITQLVEICAGGDGPSKWNTYADSCTDRAQKPPHIHHPMLVAQLVFQVCQSHPLPRVHFWEPLSPLLLGWQA